MFDREAIQADQGAGTWLLDLRSGSAWRDAAHDRVFGYEGLDGEWDFDRFMAHVRPDDHGTVYQRYLRSVDLYAPWSFTCDVTGPRGEARRIYTFGNFEPGSITLPPRLSGYVMAVPTVDAVEEGLRREMSRLRASDRTLHEALAATERAARRQPGEARERLLRHLARVARLAADTAETDAEPPRLGT